MRARISFFCARFVSAHAGVSKNNFFDFFFCLVKNIFDTGFEWVQPGSGVWPDSGFWDVLLGIKGDVRVSVMHSGRGSVGHTRFTSRVK